MQTLEANLDGTIRQPQQQINPNSVYMVDWSKMTSVNDMVLVLASMAIAFPGNHPNIQNIKHLLNLDTPIQQQGPPQAKEIKLPKLKTLK